MNYLITHSFMYNLNLKDTLQVQWKELELDPINLGLTILNLTLIYYSKPYKACYVDIMPDRFEVLVLAWR